MSTTGNTQNISTNDLEKLISYFEDSKKGVSELKKELKELNESIFSHETSLERLSRLQNELKESTKEYNKFLNTGINRELIKQVEKYNKENSKLLETQEKIKKIRFQLSKIKGNTQEELDKIDKLKDKLREECKIKSELKKEAKSYKETIEKLGSTVEEAQKKSAEADKLHSNSLKKNIELQKELNRRQVEGVTVLDDFSEKLEERSKALRKGIGEIKNGAKGIYSAVKETLKPWSEANDEAMKYARTMGMSQKTADQFLSKTVSWASKNDIGLLFNKTTKELIQMQSKYSEVLGRNVQLTDEQKKDMLAMETFLGEDGMMDIANNLENLGMGMSDSAEFVKKQLDSATKSGIVASKLTKTIRENIKMAQNYTFKNGLDGLASMAKKAIQLKTDMSLVDGFANNVSTVEGAITTGAKLQVLGGSYAMGADPLSMMYESLNDMEGLFDRAVGMAKGKVFYNEQTGNFEMGAMDRYLMKQAATTMGVDPNKMIDVAYRQASLGKIESQISANSNISGDKDMVELVKNLATWNDGKAVVNIDGKDKSVSELTTSDKEKLQAMQRTDSQNLQEMAITLRSMHDVMTGVEKETNNEQANIVKGIGEKITNFMKKQDGLLNIISKIGAWGNVLFKELIGGLLTGIYTSVNGILRSINGTGNLFDGLFDSFNGKKGKGKSVRRGVAKGKSGIRNGIKLNQFGDIFKKGGLRANSSVYNYNGHNYTLNSAGKLLNEKGVEMSSSYASRVMKNGAKGGWTNLAKSAGKGLKVGAGIGALTAAVSIGTDVATGEFQKDMGRSIGKAAGPLVGSIIGGIFGPIGSLVGGFLGDAITSGIQKEQDRVRKKIRNDISLELNGALNGTLANLFSGDNALEGNYSKRQLNKLKDALSDGTLSENEVGGGILRKARNNGDLIKMQNAGIKIGVAFAKGGLIEGKSHAEGGMPILGSNIEVEGGEYIVNKKSTRENLPLLEKINNGNYKFTAKEPLGKQMRVNESYVTNNTPQNNSKIDIKPISINLSGTIKLDTGNKQFDITNEIMNNPQLITRLTEMINKQINTLDYGTFNKNNFRQKFI